jgi:hypothetical protein
MQVGWNHNPAWVVLRPMGGVKLAQSWVKLQPSVGGFTTRGWVKLAQSWVELQPDFGGITTCGWGEVGR